MRVKRTMLLMLLKLIADLLDEIFAADAGKASDVLLDERIVTLFEDNYDLYTLVECTLEESANDYCK
jgi:hypothetical protein